MFKKGKLSVHDDHYGEDLLRCSRRGNSLSMLITKVKISLDVKGDDPLTWMLLPRLWMLDNYFL